MVNRFSQITPIQEYQSDVPVELMMKIGSMRQQQFDMNKQLLQQNLSKGKSIGSQIINDELRAEYEKQFDTASSALQKDFATADLSDATVLQQANSLFDPIAKSERFYSAYAGSLERRNVEKRYKEAAESNDGSYNEALHLESIEETNKYKSAKGDDALRMRTPGFLADQKIQERIQKLIKSMGAEADVNITDSGLNYIINNSKGYGRSRVANAISAMLTPNDLRQLRAEAKATFRESDYDSLRNRYTDIKGIDVKKLDDQINTLESQIAIGINSRTIPQRDLLQLKQAVEELKSKKQNAASEMKEFDKLYQKNPDILKFKMYQTEKMNEWLDTYAIKTEEEIKIEVNKAAEMQADFQKQAALKQIDFENDKALAIMNIQADRDLERLKYFLANSTGDPTLPSRTSVIDPKDIPDLTTLLRDQPVEAENQKASILQSMASRLGSTSGIEFIKNGQLTPAFEKALDEIKNGNTPEAKKLRKRFANELQQLESLETKQFMNNALIAGAVTEFSATLPAASKAILNHAIGGNSNNSVKNVVSKIITTYGSEVFTSDTSLLRVVRELGVTPTVAEFKSLKRGYNLMREQSEFMEGYVKKNYRSDPQSFMYAFTPYKETNQQARIVGEITQLIAEQGDDTGLKNVTILRSNRKGAVEVQYEVGSGATAKTKTTVVNIDNNPQLLQELQTRSNIPSNAYADQIYASLDYLDNNPLQSVGTNYFRSYTGEAPYRFLKSNGELILQIRNKNSAYPPASLNVNDIFSGSRQEAVKFAELLNTMPSEYRDAIVESNYSPTVINKILQTLNK